MAENAKVTEVLMGFREQVTALEKNREAEETARQNRLDLLNALYAEVQVGNAKCIYKKIKIVIKMKEMSQELSIRMEGIECITGSKDGFKEILDWDKAKGEACRQNNFSKVLNQILAGNADIQPYNY